MLVEQYDYAVHEIIRFGDGDSFWCVAEKDIGFYVKGQAAVHVRVLHLDTPERGETNYKEAAEYTKIWLLAHLQTLRIISQERDDFGRWLCEVYDSATGETLAKAVKDAGLAKPNSKWNN